MNNESGIYPIFNRVLIKPLEVEKTTSSGIVIATDELSDREQLANTTGMIMAVGEEVPDDIVQVGDKVIFAKYAGLMYTGKDDVQYRMINYDDLVGKLDPEMKLVDPHLRKGLK